MNKFTSAEFALKKRESLLDYKIYEYNFDEMVEGFAIVRESLSLSISDDLSVSLYDSAAQLEQRAWDSLVFLTNCYSGGHLIEDLAKLYPSILGYWEIFVNEWIVFQESDQSSSGTVAALPLLDTHFIFANQLVCFAILFGWGNLLKKIPKIIDFNNPRKDGMLERLLAPYIDGRGQLPDDCTRHLPYFKTLKIFSAVPEARAQLMSEYLDEWYHASRRESYYDSHKRGDQFKGYWAWEAAAITYLLDIDDSTYRDAKFYPADLVTFAYSIGAPRNSQLGFEDKELRAKSGEACPKTGTWQTLDIPLQQRWFTVGEILQAENANYGITIWRYIGD